MERQKTLFKLSDEYVEEACYYLAELKVGITTIAKQMHLTPAQTKNAMQSYKKKLESGSAHYDENTKLFWSKAMRENTGDEKITLVDEKGRYYHGWKSEIEKLPTEKLVELLAVNKKYSDRHPLSEFSKTQPAVGYDPLIPLRNIRRTVAMIDTILQQRVTKDEQTSS